MRLTLASVGFAKDIKHRRAREDAAAAMLDDAVAREGGLAVCLVRAEAQKLLSRAMRAYARVRGGGRRSFTEGRATMRPRADTSRRGPLRQRMH